VSRKTEPTASPLWLRMVRIFRLVVHLIRGLLFVCFRFPGWIQARRDRENRRWSRKLLRILSIRAQIDSLPKNFPERCLMVFNHVSWLDIILVNATQPAIFIAKSEIARWPIVGTLVTRAGTLYIERGSRSALKRTNERVSEALRAGALVACFPEGVTTLGERVGRFHGALFQPAIDVEATVLPAAILYCDANGKRSSATDYVGEDSLLKSVWQIVSAPRIIARLEFLAPLATSGMERRALSTQVHAAISERIVGTD
jgi:1-acyl-sn-glycerol-3-phosphate acyltransferase